MPKTKSKAEGKVGAAVAKFEQGKLHSGSKGGPVVKDKQQALAIGESEKRAASRAPAKKPRCK